MYTTFFFTTSMHILHTCFNSPVQLFFFQDCLSLFVGGFDPVCNQDPNIVKLLARRDFMFSSSDLRGWDLKNDSALLVPGVTHVHHIPAPEKLKNNKVGMIGDG